MQGPIDQVSVPPHSTRPEVFTPESDRFFGDWPRLVDQINEAVTAMNLNDVTDTSTSSIDISPGAKIFTVSANKSFLKGMFLNIADNDDPVANHMLVQVTGYASTSLDVQVIRHKGSGTISNWTINLSAMPRDTIADQELRLEGGNGVGSVNDKVGRFSTVVRNTSDITYVDSATDGALITINSAGIYYISFRAEISGTGDYLGVAINPSSLTTNIWQMPPDEMPILNFVSTSSYRMTSGVVRKLEVNDIFRVMSSTNLGFTSPGLVLSIFKLSDV